MAGSIRRLTRGDAPSRRQVLWWRAVGLAVLAAWAAALGVGCELFEAESGPYSVQGSVYSLGAAAKAEFNIRRGAAVIDDAEVLVNGVLVPFDLQAYRVDLAMIPPATPVTIQVDVDDVYIEKTIMMPDSPALLGPGAQSYTSPIPITWTIGTPPEYFVVFIDSMYTSSGKTWAVVLPNYEAGYTIPAYTFFPSTMSTVQLFAVNEVDDLGSDLSADSMLNLTNIDSRSIDTN